MSLHYAPNTCIRNDGIIQDQVIDGYECQAEPSGQPRQNDPLLLLAPIVKVMSSVSLRGVACIVEVMSSVRNTHRIH